MARAMGEGKGGAALAERGENRAMGDGAQRHDGGEPRHGGDLGYQKLRQALTSAGSACSPAATAHRIGDPAVDLRSPSSGRSA